MSIEYHGWIVLAKSSDDWDDGDFAEGFDQSQGMRRNGVKSRAAISSSCLWEAEKFPSIHHHRRVEDV
jgi:hypothetical protein